MKKYIVHIGSINNCLCDPNFFIGTGFGGAEFDTYDELKNLVKKYAVKDNKWKSAYIKFSFHLSTTLNSFMNEGNRQCKQNGRVNLITAALAYKKDPYRNIEIIFYPRKWIDDKGEIFKFIITKDGKNFIPFYGKKLIDACREIGINL